MATATRIHSRYISLESAAQIWGISARTLRRRISDGTITGYRVPGTRAVRVDLNELDALMKPMR